MLTRLVPRRRRTPFLSLERLEDRCTPSVTVTAQNLVATEGVPLGAPIMLAIFTDSVPTRTSVNFSATVNYGDGSATVTLGLAVVGPTNGSFTLADANPHTFPEEAVPPGGFHVTVTVTDTVDNSIGTGTGIATVNDAPLV